MTQIIKTPIKYPHVSKKNLNGINMIDYENMYLRIEKKFRYKMRYIDKNQEHLCTLSLKTKVRNVILVKRKNKRITFIFSTRLIRKKQHIDWENMQKKTLCLVVDIPLRASPAVNKKDQYLKLYFSPKSNFLRFSLKLKWCELQR